ncbi:hypothetical protein [Pseudomonas sp.]|uniref:hypothetical protein n=1 Tax=Pseudomonas sp. TaxID=306 RepID=UPI003C54E402
MEQTDEQLAEMVARFRTPPGFSWEPLRDDILTLLKSREAQRNAVETNALLATPLA